MPVREFVCSRMKSECVGAASESRERLGVRQSPLSITHIFAPVAGTQRKREGSHGATKPQRRRGIPAVCLVCPSCPFLFDLGSLRGLCGCQGPETKNLRPSAKSADSSFSDSLGIDLVRAIAPLHLPSANTAPPRDPFQNKFAKRKKRSPQISQIHADFFRLPLSHAGRTTKLFTRLSWEF